MSPAVSDFEIEGLNAGILDLNFATYTDISFLNNLKDNFYDIVAKLVSPELADMLKRTCDKEKIVKLIEIVNPLTIEELDLLSKLRDAARRWTLEVLENKESLMSNENVIRHIQALAVIVAAVYKWVVAVSEIYVW